MKLAVITPIKHIAKVYERLSAIGEIVYLPEFSEQDFSLIKHCELIFTNPNKSTVYLGEDLLKVMPNLTTIATASTGTIHIDTEFCKSLGVEVISIDKEISYLEQITSTAELALTGTLAACRHYVRCVNDANDPNNWNYENYIGRQVLNRNVGVIGHGRLGKMYSKYMSALGANLFVYDKYVSLRTDYPYNFVDSIEQIFSTCEIVSLHIHATTENIKIINEKLLSTSQDNLILVNTSRGEIVDEQAVIDFLQSHPGAMYVTDVVSDEASKRKSSAIYSAGSHKKQILLTQHIGGMTTDAQEIAYNRAVDLLEVHLSRR